MQEAKRLRNSSIETLKLIAILLITISHAIPRYGISNSTINFSIAEYSIQKFIMLVFFYCGQIGNCIFLICTSWFLLESNKVSVAKIVRMVIDTVFISLICLLIVGGVFHGWDFINIHDIYLTFLPNVSGAYWFVTCYLLIYIFHPYLNAIVNNTSREAYNILCIILFLLYSVLQIVFLEKLFYNKLIGSICIYFYSGLLKREKKLYAKLQMNNQRHVIISIVLFLTALGLWYYMGLTISFFGNKMLHFCQFINPLIMFICYSLFISFKSKQKQNNVINYISGFSLYIYLFTENYLIREYVKPLYFDKFLAGYFQGNALLGSLALFFILISFSTIMIILYRLLFNKIITFAADFCGSHITKLANNAFNSRL